MALRPQADLHFHALPGLDDGPADIDESLALLLAAERDGTTTVVATPHVRVDYRTDPSELADRAGELRRAARRAGLRVALRVGAELAHGMVYLLHQDELDAVAQGPRGARWLLVETPFEGMCEEFHAATAELRDRGFGVVLAHPERSADAALDDHRGLLRELAEGSICQINAPSITGAHGAAVRERAVALVRAGLAGLVASDAHGAARPPLLTEAGRDLVERGVDGAVVRRLIASAPLGLLARGLVADERARGLLVA